MKLNLVTEERVRKLYRNIDEVCINNIYLNILYSFQKKILHILFRMISVLVAESHWFYPELTRLPKLSHK